MATLEEILQRGKSAEGNTSTSTELSNARERVLIGVSSIVGADAGLSAASSSLSFGSIFGLKSTAEEKFSRSLAELVTSADFIEELSAIVGEPEDGESKSDFVKRSQAAMKDLIKSKLS